MTAYRNRKTDSFLLNLFFSPCHPLETFEDEERPIFYSQQSKKCLNAKEIYEKEVWNRHEQVQQL